VFSIVKNNQNVNNGERTSSFSDYVDARTNSEIVVRIDSFVESLNGEVEVVEENVDDRATLFVNALENGQRASVALENGQRASVAFENSQKIYEEFLIKNFKKNDIIIKLFTTVLQKKVFKSLTPFFINGRQINFAQSEVLNTLDQWIADPREFVNDLTKLDIRVPLFGDPRSNPENYKIIFQKLRDNLAKNGTILEFTDEVITELVNLFVPLK
jgi:hypothetical protein